MAASRPARRRPATKTITLGVLTPLTGPAALIGNPLTNGQKSFFDNVNANGGIDGWKVNLTVQDSKYDPQTQVQDYNQIAPNVLFLGQSLGSPTTQAIESLANSRGHPGRHRGAGLGVRQSEDQRRHRHALRR